MLFHHYTRDEVYKLPDDPGVYKFFSDSGIILYIGKAKNLKKRVASYFNKQNQLNRKTIRLVEEISVIEVTLVNSEFDALLLENNLIKENQPKYNILLKDDKSFPSILVTNDRFPRIYSTRRIDKNLGKYYGPYTSVKSMNHVIDLIHKLYKIRTCTYNLSKRNVEKKKYKICLEYHIGNCLGPCEGLQTEESYLNEIKQAEQILKGKIGIVKQQFKEDMLNASETLNFELAQTLKQKIEYLDKFQSRSIIVNPSITDIDVLTIISDKLLHYINYMKIEDGTIKVSETVEVKSVLDESVSEIIRYVIPILQEKYQSISTEVLCNVEADDIWGNIQLTHPQIGDKRKLLELSKRNAILFKQEKERRKQQKNKDQGLRVLKQLQQDLRMKQLPLCIECFDNSNIQGSNPVASMVSFYKGKPSKKEYRKYNIRTVIGPDDFSSMHEIITRRYSRLIRENLAFPDLIVIDGGKGQLRAATEALSELGIYGSIPIIGIAKRLEEIYFPEDPFPLHISKKSESLKLLQQIRDEAHRFAITFHRQKRSKQQHLSILDEIEGIGIKTKEKLWKKYKSIEGISSAHAEDLCDLVGSSKANLIIGFLTKEKGE